MAKRYPKVPAKNASSVKEESPMQSTAAEPRYATSDMLEKALEHVIKIHGAAFQKLAK
jgi:hypothetical protein